MDREKIAADVVDIAYFIHSKLGPGLLESIYQRIMAEMLKRKGYEVKTEVPLDFRFDGIEINNDLRLDLLINGCFIVELKSVEVLHPVHSKQLLTYLRVMRQPLGLLINFGGEFLKGNCRRIVNEYAEPEDLKRLRSTLTGVHTKEPGCKGERARSPDSSDTTA